jgi:hypothetical protein
VDGVGVGWLPPSVGVGVTTGVVPGCGVALGATDGLGVADGVTGVETCAVDTAGTFVGTRVAVTGGRVGAAVGTDTGADGTAGAVTTGVGVGTAPATISGSPDGAGDGPCASCGGGVCVGRGVLDGAGADGDEGCGAFGVAWGCSGAGCSVAGAD